MNRPYVIHMKDGTTHAVSVPWGYSDAQIVAVAGIRPWQVERVVAIQ